MILSVQRIIRREIFKYKNSEQGEHFSCLNWSSFCSFDLFSQFFQSLVNELVAPVYLLNVLDHTFSFSAE